MTSHAKSAAVEALATGILQAASIAIFETTSRHQFFTDAPLDADQLALAQAIVNRWHAATAESIAAALAAEGAL